VVAGASDDAELKLADYAWNLGMAFQLIDDVLDFTAQETVLGKPVGGDLREGKVTLPLIYALQESSPDERRLVETVLRDRSYSSVPFRSVLDMVERHAGIVRAKERAASFADKARATMAEFPDSPFQRALSAVTDLVTEREF
jgi:octaprenyl-diphosphate synthase